MIIKGNIWDHYNKYNAVCVTCNSIIKNNGELVMGAGIAKQFAEKYRWLPKYWGKRIVEFEIKQKLKPHIMVTSQDDFGNSFYTHIIYFKTKEHWKDPSYVYLIERSMIKLCECIDLLGWEKVLLPAPGCTNGGLDWEKQVYPAIKPYLDDYKEIDIIIKG